MDDNTDETRVSGYQRAKVRDSAAQLFNDTPAGDDQRLLFNDDGVLEVVRMSDFVTVRCDRIK